MTKRGTIRLNIDMEPAEHARWKAEADGEGRKLNAFVHRAVRFYLERKHGWEAEDSGPRPVPRRGANGGARNDERDARR